MSFTFVDLFAGIGGFRLALERAGGKCLGFSEINADAIQTYRVNYHCDSEENFGDVTQIKDLPNHDILTAGVPCQSWSIAGKNLGFDDDRGQLWNDTLYLLNQVRPKAFIFENVKGLSDPRNQEALMYIMHRIREAGYYANFYTLNSYDYGVLQSRVRIYIIGFLDLKYYLKFELPQACSTHLKLQDIVDVDYYQEKKSIPQISAQEQIELFSEKIEIPKSNKSVMSLSANLQGLNDYFLFNDLRDGHSTIHSWDILDTTDKQKKICLLMLKNRRKSKYGLLDGNPLSVEHLQELDPSIALEDVAQLVSLEILKKINYKFMICKPQFDVESLILEEKVTEQEKLVLSKAVHGVFSLDQLKQSNALKSLRKTIPVILADLCSNGILRCIEERYDFKNTKISTGLFGVNRIFLPSSNIFPTLVASDSLDYIATKTFQFSSPLEYKQRFLEEIYFPKNYRRINQQEACRIQGFPDDFILPSQRSRWIKLLGNSVAVPVIERLVGAIVDTGVFSEKSESLAQSKSIVKSFQ